MLVKKRDLKPIFKLPPRKLQRANPIQSKPKKKKRKVCVGGIVVSIAALQSKQEEGKLEQKSMKLK